MKVLWNNFKLKFKENLRTVTKGKIELTILKKLIS